jgi:hypothetical protein
MKIKSYFSFSILILGLSMVSFPAMAADMLPWKTYLLSVMFISLVIASFISIRSAKADSLMGKLLLAGLYFWVFTFAQLTMLALIYYFNK